MPIVIDTNDKDLDQQIQSINKQLSTHQQVNAKYFSDALTGTGKGKTGFFNATNSRVEDFIKENQRLLKDDYIAFESYNSRILDDFQEERLGNTYDNHSKNDAKNFAPFAHILPTVMHPFEINNINAPQTDVLVLPKSTFLYNLNALEDVWVKVSDKNNISTYVRLIVNGVRLYSRKIEQNMNGTLKKKLQVAGAAGFSLAIASVENDMNPDGSIKLSNRTQIQTPSHDIGYLSVTSLEVDPFTQQLSIEDALHDHMLALNLPIIMKDTTRVIKDLHDTNMADILESQAMNMCHHANNILTDYAESYARYVQALIAQNNNDPFAIDDINNQAVKTLTLFAQTLDAINTTDNRLVDTDVLAHLYGVFKSTQLNQHVINGMTRHSLRLLLSQRLHELNALKDNNGLYAFQPQDAQVTQDMKQSQTYSVQQKKIIGTTEPLVIGQAGAGSGKSHTLIGRINYLQDQGEDLKKVLVLSFTNVAAKNIKQRFSGVRSETLANMFHTIYKESFPTQELSQPSTVANAIRLLNLNSSYFNHLNKSVDDMAHFASKLANQLEKFDQTGFKRVDVQHELKVLSNLVEEDLELTEMILNAVEQTTLEIEPIIIHHNLLNAPDALNIPEKYQNLNYIITDESQDISTFEYILLLELTLHYRSQLLIIGDGSQTLYEFRNSDPRYMNALESSGVFTSYKLDTNYRSNEEILMYANQILDVIDANRYAKIQLKSANFSKVTAQSFAEKVIVEDNIMSSTRQKDYVESLETFFDNNPQFEQWFIERVKKGEQVALLGWTRAEVLASGEVLRDILERNGLADKEVASIMSDNKRPMTILSRFAYRGKSQLESIDPLLPPHEYLAKIDQTANSFIAETFRYASPNQIQFFKDLIHRTVKTVVYSNQWQAMCRDYAQSNLITINMLTGHLLRELLRVETKQNAMNTYIDKDDEPDYSNIPVVLSTIHGSKGLEFDHTVVLYNENKKGAASQESLRMMFVALSRAKQSEYIVNTYSEAKANMRTVSGHASAMFETPIPTAYLRVAQSL